MERDELRLHLADDPAEYPRRGRSHMHVVNDPDLIPPARGPIYEDAPRPELRQVAKILTVAPEMLPYLDWEQIGRDADTLMSSVDAKRHEDGTLVVTWYWHTPKESTHGSTGSGTPSGGMRGEG